MITLPIGRTEIRAMHGSAAAMSILAILADEPGMTFDLTYLATATGYESKGALIKACRLLALLHLVGFDEPRPNILRNIRLTAALQLALPSTQHTLPAGPSLLTPGEQHTENAGAEHKTREIFSRENFSPVVVVGVNQVITDSVKQQQQQTGTNSFRVRGLLKAIGIWANVADGFQEADLADVLGWIAYVSDPDQKIRNKPALVSNALGAGRPASRPYRPELICQDCRRIEGACDCGGELHMPAEYDALAFQPPAPSWGVDVADWLAKRWFCPECQAFPCQCAKDDAE